MAAVSLAPFAAQADPPPAADTLRLAPPDPRLAALYEGSCKSCHAGAPETGAPQLHDRPAWISRWRKGEAELLDNTVLGVGGMPSNGACRACTEADLKALIRFLADR